jgi:hypothetical protein
MTAQSQGCYRICCGESRDLLTEEDYLITRLPTDGENGLAGRFVFKYCPKGLSEAG